MSNERNSDEFARMQGDPTMEQFASDHPITQQRVYNFLCLLEGSDPENLHGSLVDAGYLPETRAPLCPMEWAQLNYGWWTVFEPHFSEAFREQGTKAQEQARDQLIVENEAFAKEIQKIRTGTERGRGAMPLHLYPTRRSPSTRTEKGI